MSKRILKNTRILRERGIKMPNNFVEVLREQQELYYPREIGPSGKTIESIILAAQQWKHYIDEDQFDELVCKMVMKMYRIHATVVSSNPETRAFFGNLVKVKEMPKDLLITKVQFEGSLDIIRE